MAFSTWPRNVDFVPTATAQLMRLRDLPVLRETPGGAFPDGDVGAYAPQAVPPTNVLMIDAEVLPSPEAELLSIESALLGSGRVIGFPAVSRVSGMVVPRGIRYVPAGRTLGTAAEIMVPVPIGFFAGNATAEQAFRVAHELWASHVWPESSAARHSVALGLSVGADAPNGEWWIAGGLSGLLGQDAEQELAAVMSDPASLMPTRQSLARRVRTELDLPVEVLDRRQSKTLRSLLPQFCPEDLWHSFIEACTDLGDETLVSRYRKAANRIWASPEMETA